MGAGQMNTERHNNQLQRTALCAAGDLLVKSLGLSTRPARV